MSSTTGAARRGVLTPRGASLTQFVLFGLALGAWAARVPAVQDQVGVSAGVLGAVLLAATVGALVAARIAPWAVERLGVGRATALAFAVVPVALVLLGGASSIGTLAVALAVFGFCQGALEVSVNAGAVEIERQSGRPLITFGHGVYAFGTVGGALSGAGAVGLGASPLAHFALIGGVCGLGGGLAARVVQGAGRSAGEDDRDDDADNPRPTAWLMVVAFCLLYGEAGVFGWASVYLRDVGGAGPALAAVGFGVVAMGFGTIRLFADRIATAVGTMRLVVAGSLLGAVSLVGEAVASSVAIMVAFLALFGISAGVAAPLLFREASRRAGIGGIANMASAGYIGYVAAPAVVGAVSGVGGLRVGILLVSLSLVAAAVAVGADRGCGSTAGRRPPRAR